MTPLPTGAPEPASINHPETHLAMLINEGLKRKGITIQKLSEISGVALKNLENLSGGNTEKFPAAPYLRSYLLIIGQVLDFDGPAIWDSIRSDELAVRSGKNDRLPRERKAISSKRNWFWIGGVATLLAVYLLFRLPEIVGKPQLEMGFPTEDVSTVNVTPISLAGKVVNGDEFFINGERIPLDKDGLWQKNIDLQTGINTVELRAKKFLGQELRVLRQIIYTPATSSVKISSSTIMDTLNTSSSDNPPTSPNKEKPSSSQQ